MPPGSDEPDDRTAQSNPKHRPTLHAHFPALQNEYLQRDVTEIVTGNVADHESGKQENRESRLYSRKAREAETILCRAGCAGGTPSTHTVRNIIQSEASPLFLSLAYAKARRTSRLLDLSADELGRARVLITEALPGLDVVKDMSGEIPDNALSRVGPDGISHVEGVTFVQPVKALQLHGRLQPWVSTPPLGITTTEVEGVVAYVTMGKETRFAYGKTRTAALTCLKRKVTGALAHNLTAGADREEDDDAWLV